MKKTVDEVLKEDGPVFCEIFTDTKQVWEPKSSTKRLEELKKQMFIPLMDEE